LILLFTLNDVVDLLIVVVRVCNLNLKFRSVIVLMVGCIVTGLVVVHLFEHIVLNLIMGILKTLYVCFSLLCEDLWVLEGLFVVTDR
jgi:hypothetical protein